MRSLLEWVIECAAVVVGTCVALGVMAVALTPVVGFVWLVWKLALVIGGGA